MLSKDAPETRRYTTAECTMLLSDVMKQWQNVKKHPSQVMVGGPKLEEHAKILSPSQDG